LRTKAREPAPFASNDAGGQMKAVRLLFALVALPVSISGARNGGIDG
jgi:hypothetical protein